MNKYRSISLNGDHGRGMNGQIIEIIDVKIQLYKLKMIQYSLQPHPLETVSSTLVSRPELKVPIQLRISKNT